MIGIVNYGMGNLLSVLSALEFVGADAAICNHPDQLCDADRIILPGVGAFRDCMNNLHRLGFVDSLNEMVLCKGKPILGICLGLQAMAMHSQEGGVHAGLGWFDAEVCRIEPRDPNARVPHVGWNEVSFLTDRAPFTGLPYSVELYFVHSYTMRCHQKEDIVAVCSHGSDTITAAVCKANICATQFHPEKSQDFGIRILHNFVNWKP